MLEVRHLRWWVSVAFALLIFIAAFADLSTSQREYLFSSETKFNVYLAPWHIDSADLNNDGFNDLVTANRDSGSVTVALNSGSGGFEDFWTYAVGYSPWELDLADLDGDGDVDIAVTLNGYVVIGPQEDDFDFVAVLFNDGGGKFSGLKRYPVGNDPRTVFLADLGEDGNGDVDIITANEQATSSVSVLFNDGSGSFSVAQNYSLGIKPISLFVSDLNGDGFNDTVTANKQDNITIMFNDGTGTFANINETHIGWEPYAVYLENVTGGPSKDIVVLEKHDGVVVVRENDGTGNFTFAGSYEIENNKSEYMVVGDADLDGYMDILCASSSDNVLSILYYNSTTSDYDLIRRTLTGGLRSFVLEDLSIGRPGMMNIATSNCIDDSVTILVSDARPTITIIEPDGIDDTVEFDFRIKWEDFDPDSNAFVQIYYYPAGLPSSTTLLGSIDENDPADFLVWNVSSLDEGKYYIKMVITDDFSTVTAISDGPITVHFPKPETSGGTNPSLGLVIVAIVATAVMIILLYYVIRKKPQPTDEPQIDQEMKLEQSPDGTSGRP